MYIHAAMNLSPKACNHVISSKTGIEMVVEEVIDSEYDLRARVERDENMNVIKFAIDSMW